MYIYCFFTLSMIIRLVYLSIKYFYIKKQIINFNHWFYKFLNRDKRKKNECF